VACSLQLSSQQPGSSHWQWALGEFGFDLGPLIASAGVVGVALGLGAQTLVRDIFVRNLYVN
jgi:hypothetical protein